MRPYKIVTVNYPIRVTVSQLTNDIIEWYDSIGGNIGLDYHKRKVIGYGNGKLCHRYAGSPQCLLHFNGEDAGVVTMLLLIFPELIISHNLTEYENYAY